MRAIPSAPGYFADTNGRIFREKPNGLRALSPQTNGRGYLRLKLSVNNKQRDAYIHRLVCEAYHGPCPENMQCRHLDGNRQNNRPTNLAWSDKKTNEDDKIIHGTRQFGERHHRSVLDEATVIEARCRARAGERVDHIATTMGVGYRALLNAVTGRRWSHIPGAVTNLTKGAQRLQAEARDRGIKLSRPRRRGICDGAA